MSKRELLYSLALAPILFFSLIGCSNDYRVAQFQAHVVNHRQNSPSIELSIPQISPCNDSEETSVLLDNNAPLTVLVHGCWSSAGKFSTLSEIFAFHNQQTVCFNYDDRASMDETSEQLLSSLEAISNLTDIDQMTIVGHSQGGLVARRAFSGGAGWNSEDTHLSLVTISSPFAGINAAGHCGSTIATYLTFGLSKGLCYLISGDKWDEIYPGADFIRVPGSLVDTVPLHLKIVTDEEGSCRVRSNEGTCLKDDYVFSLDEQYLDAVDDDPIVRNIVLQEGHVAVIGSENRPPNKLIRVLKESGLLSETPPGRIAAFERMLTKLF